MLSTQFQLTEQDYLAFLRLHNIASIPRGLAILGLASVAMMVFGWFSRDSDFAVSVIATTLAVTVLYGLLLHFVILPRHTSKTWREYALIKEEVSLTVSRDGFHFVQPSAHVDVKWANVVKWDENDTIFVVYATRQLAYIFPKRACDATLLVVARDGLLGSGLVQKGKPRK